MLFWGDLVFWLPYLQITSSLPVSALFAPILSCSSRYGTTRIVAVTERGNDLT
jgi:formate hydrogenlyase subunit 3/multisubunit Na+/H+ antiporter MnhD subunit